MEWGNKQEFLDALQKSTGEIPKALKDRPRLTQWTAEYYAAFSILSDSRQLGEGGVGPIPLSEMRAYMDLYNVIKVDDRDRFIKMLKALDRVYMQHINARLKQERDARTKKYKSARPVRRGRR